MPQLRLFVYGTMMQGERDHAWLERANFLGMARTAPRYTLVDIGPCAALLLDGGVSIVGELYEIELMQLAIVDGACQVPHLYQRRTIALSDDTEAETHTMSMEQARGKRRLSHGNWRERFAPRSVPHRNLAFAQWARQRAGKR